jgi:excisionase family DNA binding protein
MNLLTAKDVARRLNISERTALRLLARGEIEAFKVSGKIWRVEEAQLEDYIRRARELQQREAA